MNREAVKDRIGSVIAEVVHHAVCEAGASGVVLLDDGTSEARLALEWCTQAVGADGVTVVSPPDGETFDGVLAALGAVGVPHAHVREEAQRFRARLEAASRGALLAHPANKTALVLGERMPPETLLPLGDLYASQVAELTGEWSAPDEVRRLADEAGGIDVLDAALSAWLAGRRALDDALRPLPGGGVAVRRALMAGRFWRRRVGIVPKLGFRTLGIDLIG